MRKPRKTFSTAVLLVIFMTLTIVVTQFHTISPAYADVPDESHTAHAMWIEPSTIDLSTDTVSVGYKFNVTVWLNLTVACAAWEFKIGYNTNHLTATRCAYTAGMKSQFFENVTTLPLSPSFGAINITHDFVLHAELWGLSGPFRNPGYGSLAWVEFEVSAVPGEDEAYTSLLALVDVYPEGTETYAQDSNQNYVALNVFHTTYKISGPEWTPPTTYKLTISSTSGGTTSPAPGIHEYDADATATVTALPESGYSFDHWELDSVTQTENPVDIIMDQNYTLLAVFSVTPLEGETILYVDPPEINDPELEPCSTFFINVSIINVTAMTVCEFNLTYDPTIIGWIGVSVHKIQDQYPTPLMMFDDESGFIWAQLTYQTVSTESSPLVTIYFHVEAYGCTPLDLHDTALTNSTGGSIEHEVQDGLFCTLIRDVAIIDVYASDSWTYVGCAPYPFNITVVAKNKGLIAETFTVTAYYDGVPIDSSVVEDLPPDSEIILTFDCDTENVTSCSNYTISAEASVVPYELNTTDNTYTDGQVYVRLLGDLNGDGKIRIDDVYLAVEAFGSEPGHPRWNPAADLNCDDRVRVDDIYLIATGFGQECAP